MAAQSPVPTFDDLKITYHESSLVIPSQEIEEKSIFLSNIDQILNYSIPTAHFFKPNPDFPSENVAKRLKMALEKVLVHYDFMAGRLKLNSKTGRLEMDCNGAGAGFVVASSEFSLDEIGSSLVYPNLGYRQLAAQKLENLAPQVDQPLCFFQVTSFKCGGFAIGMCMNHILLDGLGAKTFIENLASQAFDDKHLAVIPCNDRWLLAARSPPQVAFPHPEFLDLHLPVGEGSSPPVFDCSREELEFKIFKLSPTDITKLKKKANNGSEAAKISSFGVVAALIWRCKAFSGSAELQKKDRISTLLNVIDIRPRRNPQLPSSYSGNGVLPLGVSATFEELENGPFSKLVEKISEGAKVMTDEYIKSAFDWMEMHRGLPQGDYMVSSWLRLGFEKIEYPWGKPVYCCPVVNHRKDICWVFPDAIDGGIGAMVALPGEEMERFDGIFREFIQRLG
ncbi:HXXXD-type acyl-transferase family protein [Perilla frutescens var. hirtella]|uniref:HXXXD-type acyl-transferase family protein n=1 Tax=Perilla frutescens var. hirtella TaxID=608512 RepID=A0AAD4ITE2_PERFH|nr:HXXXD-type acyl-transferase family protein [Perilla frutescens var. hirtella]